MTNPLDGDLLREIPQDFRRRLRVAMSQPKQGVRNPAPWYQIRNEADTGIRDETDIYLYDVIGGWCGVTAEQFVAELNTIESPVINLHISSPGGDVFDAIAIFQALRNHKARIVTYVDSLAASAASFIAMAGDKRIIAPYGSVMIHDAWGLCVGNATEMTKMQSELDRLSNIIASIYADRGSGGDKAEWRQAMLDESWYGAQEAVDAGLMHEVQEDVEKTGDGDSADVKARNRWDLSVFNYAGREQAPAPKFPGRPTALAADVATDTPAAEPVPNTEPKEGGVSTLSTDVLARLGLTEGADDTAVLAAIDDLKVKASAPVEPDLEDDGEDEPVTAPDPQPVPPVEEPQPAAQVAAYAAELARVSAELAAIKAKHAADDKRVLFDSVVAAGKITPADRATWEARYDEAPKTVGDILASIAPGTAVPMQPAGHVGNGDDTATIDAEYEALVAGIDGPTATKGA